MLHEPRFPEKASRLLAIIRQPYGLHARLNRPRFPSAPIAQAQQTWCPQDIDWANFYETVLLPVDKVPLSLYPRRDVLLTSWRFLQEVRTLEANVLLHVLIVLLQAVSGTHPEDSALPALDLTPERVPPHATAAHPRAFKGTKYRPPKRQHRDTVDLRPYLNNARELQRLLRSLRDHLPVVLAQLATAGYASTPLEAIRRTVTSSCRPLVMGLSTTSLGVAASSLSPWFLQDLLPSLTALPPQERRAYVALFHALALHDDHALRHAISRLVSLQNSSLTRAWCWLVEQLPAARRSPFVAYLLESDTYRHDPGKVTPAIVAEFNRLTSDTHYNAWVPLFLEAIRKEVSLDYMLAGFRLAAMCKMRSTFTITGDCPAFPVDVIEAFVLSCPDDSLDSGWYALRAWERCGQFPELADVLHRTQWQRFTPTMAWRYLRCVLDVFYHDMSAEAFAKKWAVVREQLPMIESLVHATAPPYQERLLDELTGYLWQWDTPAALRNFLPGAYALSRRLSAPPFRTDVELSLLLGNFLESPDDKLRTAFLAAPDSSFHVLEKHCRRDNTARLLGWGLHTLTRFCRDVAVRAFRRFPNKLCKTATVLGGLPEARRTACLYQLAGHPLFAQDIAELSAKDACLLVQNACAGRYWNPLPRYLAAWVQGRYTLTPTRIERYRRVLLDNLDCTRLDCIEQHVLEVLSQGLPVPSQPQSHARHALRLLGDIAENRRGLRRFLQAYWQGDGHYLLRHPATQSWLRQPLSAPPSGNPVLAAAASPRARRGVDHRGAVRRTRRGCARADDRCGTRPVGSAASGHLRGVVPRPGRRV